MPAFIVIARLMRKYAGDLLGMLARAIFFWEVMGSPETLTRDEARDLDRFLGDNYFPHNIIDKEDE